MRPGALGRAGDGSEVADVGHPVENHHQRRFVFGHALQNIGQPDIFDGRDLRHDTLMVAARQAVEFLDRHLLHTHLMPEAEVSQLRHQLPLGALADVELFDLFSGLDRFGHGTYPENDIVHIRMIYCFSIAYPEYRKRGRAGYPCSSTISSSYDAFSHSCIWWS